MSDGRCEICNSFFCNGEQHFKSQKPPLKKMAEAVDTELPKLSSEELKLRRMLCIAYAGALAYMDDGEAQDSRETPFIDFLRDSADTIEAKMKERGKKRLAEQATVHVSVPHSVTITDSKGTVFVGHLEPSSDQPETCQHEWKRDKKSNGKTLFCISCRQTFP